MKSLLTLSTLSLALAIPLALPTSAHAAQYSAARANSVRLVWRGTMQAHSYHTNRGARYSKHLGLRYAYNRENITWITNAHEKLYDKQTHTSAIYYHVNSADGRHGGWIWRGYLVAGVAVTSGTTTGTSTPTTSTTTSTTTDATDDANTRLENQLETLIRGLFPGTIADSHLLQTTSDIIFPTDGVDAEFITAPQGQTLIRLSYPVTQDTYAKTYDRLLTQQGYPASKRAQYKGWHIGVSVQGDDEYGEGVSQGDAAILLAPAN